MKFSEMALKKTEEIMKVGVKHDFEVNKLSYNSNKVESGDIFFAIKGFKTDGNKYINDAISKGAQAVITDMMPEMEDSRLYKVEDVRKTMALMSTEYYGNPSEKMKLIGVTGTNGKTTVTSLINHAVSQAGMKTGLIGTNGNYINRRFIETEFTTPESVELNKLLADMQSADVEFVTMEVSSHSLALKRVYGIDFDVVVFTNLTPEHLDFHESMENYFEAKKRLFDSMKRINGKGNRTSVIYNNDDEYGRRIIGKTESARISYGFEPSSYSVKDLKMNFDSMSFKMLVPLNGEGINEFDVTSKLIGRFNVYNILAASAALKSLNLTYSQIRGSIESFKPVTGRFNQIKLENGATAIIDYSHTPDSLFNALSTIREIMASSGAAGKIITVFGCGGNRDKTKRPKMGEIAAGLSGEVIVTSDNPRDEEPMAIINDILKGIKTDNYKIEVDREKAIIKAIELSSGNDVILVAGKGHENYQEIKGVKYHLSDSEIVERFCK